MELTQQQKKRAGELHYSNFVFDYYPQGIPLVIDEQVKEYVAENLARGVDGAAILAGFHDLYLKEMESGSARGTRIKQQLEKSLEKSGVNCIAITMGNPSRPLMDLNNITTAIAWWKRFFGTFDGMVECHTPEEVEKSYVNKKVSALFCLQDGGCIGENINLLEILYNEGVRFIQVSFNKANAIGHGSTESKEKGLTEFGKKVVEKMNALRMVVDVSHCNYQTTLDAIRSSEKPVMVTHSSCKSVFTHDRAKTDEEIKALAENNGFFGVLLVPSFLSANPRPDFDIVIKHLRHAISIMGIDRVGIGSDWGLWSPDVPEELTEAMIQSAIKNLGLSKKMNLVAGVAPGEMKDYSDMYMVTEALVGAGFSDEQIKQIIGENFMDFWKRAVDT